MLGAMSAAALAEPRPVEYRLELVPSLGMETGVTNLTTVARLALRGADVVLAHRGPVVRLVAGVAFDAAVAIEAIVLPHEVFGHGARARELGFEPSYVVKPPPPYAWLVRSGLRSSTDWDFGDLPPATLDETALFYLGGLEAGALQLRSLAFTALRARTLTRGDALLYATASLELTSYAARADGDLSLFYAHLHNRYGADTDTERRRTRLSAAVAAVDPLFLVSLYSYFYRYLVCGDRAVSYPALDVGDTQASLTTGLLLVPWGREHQVTTLIGTHDGDFAATVGIGEGPGGSSVSLSLAAADLPLTHGLFAVGRLEAAYQPRLSIRGEAGAGILGRTLPYRGSIVGDVGLDYRFGRWVIGARLGSKTAGYTVGRPYAPTWTALVSVAARIGSD